MKTNFYLRDERKDKPGAPRPVYLFLTYAPGKRIKHPVGKGIAVTTDKWDGDEQRANDHGNAILSEINDKLTAFEERVKLHFENIRKQRQAEANVAGTDPVQLTYSEIKHHLNVMTGKVKVVEATDLNKFVIAECARMTAKAKKQGKETFKTVDHFRLHWEGFYNSEKTKPDWFNLDYQMLKRFGVYLGKQTVKVGGVRRVDTGRQLAVSTRLQVISTFYGILTTAVKAKYLKYPIHTIVDPSELVDEDEDIREGEWYLTFEEIAAIANVDLSGRGVGIQKSRDAFVSACLHGQRVSDWPKLSATAVHVDVNGLPFQKVATKKGRKEKKRAFVPMHPYTLEALKTWGTFDQDMQMVNYNLKKVAAAAGVDRVVIRRGEERPMYETISSHLARKTFESNHRDINTPQSVIDVVTTHGQKQQSDYYDNRNLAKKVRDGVKYLLQYEAKIFGNEETGAATVRKIA